MGNNTECWEFSIRELKFLQKWFDPCFHYQLVLGEYVNLLKIIINSLWSIKLTLPSRSRPSRKAYSKVTQQVQYGLISVISTCQNYTVVHEFIYLVFVSPIRQLTPWGQGPCFFCCSTYDTFCKLNIFKWMKESFILQVRKAASMLERIILGKVGS